MMFEFDQYLGFLAFLFLITVGFWIMMFLVSFVIPFWIGGALKERYKEHKEAKRKKSETEALNQ